MVSSNISILRDFWIEFLKACMGVLVLWQTLQTYMHVNAFTLRTQVLRILVNTENTNHYKSGISGDVRTMRRSEAWPGVKRCTRRHAEREGGGAFTRICLLIFKGGRVALLLNGPIQAQFR